MPYCTNCGQEISEEDFEFFEKKCIDCVHGVSMDKGIKLTSGVCISFFGVLFFISSLISILQVILQVIFQVIFDSYYRLEINFTMILLILIFHGISIVLIAIGIQRVRTVQYQ